MIAWAIHKKDESGTFRAYSMTYTNFRSVKRADEMLNAWREDWAHAHGCSLVGEFVARPYVGGTLDNYGVGREGR